MGAHIRFKERAFERRLAANATKGVQAPAVPAWGTADGGADSDRRGAIPPLGLREYWYPLAPVGRVPRRKPLFWNMLGDELVLFRDEQGEVKAISDVCPHRGASMAQGKCFFKGTITCPYHGATFDARGECVAYITEGPDSRMVNNRHMRIRTYPTITLKGWVFVWMGDSEPVDPEQDIPPEFFAPKNILVLSTYTYWQNSWIVAIENAYDSHNQGLFVHRNSLNQIMAGRSLPRIPHGTRSKLVDDVALFAWRENENYYADETGKVPFQLYYPGVDAKWPKTMVRKWVGSAFKPWRKYVVNNPLRKRWLGQVHADFPEAWKPGAHRLPGMVRLGGGHSIFNRWPVAVDVNWSRIVYHHAYVANNVYTRTWIKFKFELFYKWLQDYNFSGQDNAAASPCRYWTPEHLTPSDTHVRLLRRLILERSRDAQLGLIQPTTVTAVVEESAADYTLADDSLDTAADPTIKRVIYDGTRIRI